MERPKISIIMPSYNQAKYLDRAIKSVIDQNYPKLEFIIIDGGSDDGSVDVIKKYKANISSWVSEPDSGQSNALNKGFAIATGEIIGWLNSDDMYCPDALSSVADALSGEPDADACYGGLFIVDKDDKIINSVWPGPPDPRYNFYLGLSIHQQALFWKRDLFSRIGFLDETLHFAMDLDFILRILIQGRLIRLKKHLGKFRLHESGKSSNLAELSRREHQIIYDRYRDHFQSRLPDSLNRVRLRSLHHINVLIDAPLSYTLFKLGRMIGLSTEPRWHNE